MFCMTTSYASIKEIKSRSFVERRSLNAGCRATKNKKILLLNEALALDLARLSSFTL